MRRDARGDAQAVVVAMGHDQPAHEASGHAPAGGVGKLLRAFAILVADARSAGEIGAEVVRRAGLKRLAVLHHRLDRPGFVRAGKALVLRLLARDHGNREILFGAGAVHLERAMGLGARFVAGRVGGMPLLPQEFAGAQEHPGAHFPAHHVGPLIEHQRQVAPALHPARHGIADDRFRSRAHDQRFFQLRVRIGHQSPAFARDQPVMGDDRHLLGEALDMGRLALEIGKRDEDREVDVLDARRLDPVIHQALDALPYAEAPRLDHHAAAHARFLRHVGRGDDLLVPLGEIVGAPSVERVADRERCRRQGGVPGVGEVGLTSAGAVALLGQIVEPLLHLRHLFAHRGEFVGGFDR